MKSHNKILPIDRRFRGLLPIVVDVETAGLHCDINALLEIAIVQLGMSAEGKWYPAKTHACHVEPFPGAVLDQDALEIHGIDPFYALRFALPEKQALHLIFSAIREQLRQTGCYRAVLVGHNAWFDLSFVLAAARRAKIKSIPFHAFTVFDTASLSAIALGETVLARAARRARIPFNVAEAHSAIYDAERTAELFCHIVNRS